MALEDRGGRLKVNTNSFHLLGLLLKGSGLGKMSTSF